MRSIRANALLSTVCANARVKKPTLAIRPLVGGYGFYNPFVNRITLDSRVVEGLSTVDLTILVAHEIGHVRQRRLLLQSATPYIVAIFTILTAAMTGLAMIPSTSECAVFVLGCAMIAGLVFELFAARWRPLMAELENDADAFADEYVGQTGAARAIAPRCESLMV